MHTLNKPTCIATTFIPAGAQVVNKRDKFIWDQLMTAICVLSGKYPNNRIETEYTTDGKQCYAILDENGNLYIWELEPIIHH